MKLNDMDLNKLAVFMVVARLGGISKAAAQLRLTPSAVSQSIKNLEDSLEARLFDRVGKSFHLSPQGQKLYEGLEHYQTGLSEALSRVRGSRHAIKGVIRLGVFYGYSNTDLAAFLAWMHRENPQIQIDITFAAPSELDRLVHEKRLDFAINLFRSERSLGLEQTEILAEELWLVSAQKPPRRSLETSELRKAPFIDYYRKSQLIAAWTQHHFGKRIRDFNVVMHAAHSELVVQLILKGVGIGIVASSIARPHVEAGRLFVIRGRQAQLKSSIWIKEQTGSDKDPARLFFRDHLLRYFHE
ncbi:LysR family transcriptional regulator [Oligoflexus tunisiensis]|uniref:LysR family transcriptional regulator n=1 Tax=Oligoflexus tunisiensis TaxID=708132 RepID=UPI00114CB358|nr:LysR family transcriptional regulator [Oligoflexus tunisiensis]